MTTETETIASFPVWVHDFGSVASILSLVFSVWAIAKVHLATQHFRQLALIPQFKSKVTGHLRNLDAQRLEKDWRSFKREAAEAIATTDHAIVLLSGSAKTSVKVARQHARKVRDVDSSGFHDESAERLVLALIETESHLKYFIENKKWQ